MRQRLIAFVTLLVCVGLLPLHSGAIGVDGYSLWTLSQVSFLTTDRPDTLLAQAPVMEAPSDGRHAPTTTAIPHCDFEVSPIDYPPLCLFAPPESVRTCDRQPSPTPCFFTSDPASPPPRQA